MYVCLFVCLYDFIRLLVCFCVCLRSSGEPSSTSTRIAKNAIGIEVVPQRPYRLPAYLRFPACFPWDAFGGLGPFSGQQEAVHNVRLSSPIEGPPNYSKKQPIYMSFWDECQYFGDQEWPTRAQRPGHTVDDRNPA